MLTVNCPRFLCLLLLLASAACGDDADPEVWLPPDEAAGDMRSGFTTFCAGYAERSLEGDLVLSAATEDDLAALGCLTAVGGDVWVLRNTPLADFSGLEALTTVGGDLNIGSNNGLTSLAGLESVTTVAGDISIRGNSGLDEPGRLERTCLDWPRS